MCSVLLHLEELLAKSGHEGAVREAVRAQDLCTFAVMTCVIRPDGTCSRELAVYSRSQDHLGRLCRFLEREDSGLDLRVIQHQQEEQEGLCARMYSQQNSRASRKMVAPLIVQFEERESSEEGRAAGSSSVERSGHGLDCNSGDCIF